MVVVVIKVLSNVYICIFVNIKYNYVFYVFYNYYIYIYYNICKFETIFTLIYYMSFKSLNINNYVYIIKVYTF